MSIEGSQITINWVRERVPYDRDPRERFKPPQTGGELLLVRESKGAEYNPWKDPDVTFYSFLYQYPDDEKNKGKYEWVKVYGHGDMTNSPEEINARIHSSCIFSERIGSKECDCKAQFTAAHEVMTQEAKERGRPGLLVYLEQEGRGHGFFNKLRIYEEMGLIDPENGIGIRSGSPEKLKMSTYEACDKLELQHDSRDYSGAKAVLEYFKTKKAYLMDDNPLKKAALSKIGITVEPKVLMVIAPVEATEYLEHKEEHFKKLEEKL